MAATAPASPLDPADESTLLDPGAEPMINDPGNEDPGSIERDALVPLIEDDEQDPEAP